MPLDSPKKKGTKRFFWIQLVTLFRHAIIVETPVFPQKNCQPKLIIPMLLIVIIKQDYCPASEFITPY